MFCLYPWRSLFQNLLANLLDQKKGACYNSGTEGCFARESSMGAGPVRKPGGARMVD